MNAPTDLSTLGAGVEWTDSVAATAAEHATPPGAGNLGELARWIAATNGAGSPRPPARARALVLVEAGTAVVDAVAALADRVGVTVQAVEVPCGVEDAYRLGVTLADRSADEATDLMVVSGAVPAGEKAAALVCVLTGTEPVALLPRGAAAVDTHGWIARAELLRDTRRDVADLRGEPDALLQALGSPAIALAAALIMRSAARRTPLLLDGTLAVAAAVLCAGVQVRAGRWWHVVDAADDPVHRAAVRELAQDPVLGIGYTRDDGLAGVLAVDVVHAAAALVGAAATRRASADDAATDGASA